MNEEEKKEDLKNDLECVDCVKIFKCKGKPREVDRCLNFEERRKK